MTTPKSATPSNAQPLHQEQAAALLKQAIAIHRKGQLDEAESIYRRVLEAFPDHANALQLLGALRGAKGDTAESLTLLEKSLTLDPSANHVRMNLARTYLRMKRVEDAIITFRKATEANPLAGETWVGLGACYETSGKMQEAITTYEAGLKQNPTHIQLLINLGVAYLNTGQLPQSEKTFRTILELDPTNTTGMNGLGSALQQQGQANEAIRYFKQAVARDPHSADGYINLGFAQHELRHYAEAVANAEKAVELAPASAVAFNNLSITLLSVVRVKEAEAAARRAVELDPSYPFAHNNLGNALHSQGRKEEAKTAYLKALELNPAYSQAYRNLGQVHKFTREDIPLIEQMEAHFKRRASDHDRKHMGFALGAAYDNLKEPDKAFPYYAEGNRQARKAITFSLNAAKAFFDEIKNAYSPEFVRTMPTSGIDDTTPFFILGMPRSGTTLVEQILASHPDVFGAEELAYMGRIANENAREWFGKPFPRYVTNATPDDLQKIGRVYLDKLRQHDAHAKHITDKMPANFQFIGLILQTLPHAKIIHCTRSPMDNCFSIFKYFFIGNISYAYDLEELGGYYLLYRDLMAHWQTCFGDRIFEVEYEKMVAEPESLIPRLVEYCGLPWNDACLNFHNTERTVRTASAMQVRKPIYTTSMEAWRPYEKHLKPLYDILHKGGAIPS